jgi:hypothetical protein
LRGALAVVEEALLGRAVPSSVAVGRTRLAHRHCPPRHEHARFARAVVLVVGVTLPVDLGFFTGVVGRGSAYDRGGREPSLLGEGLVVSVALVAGISVAIIATLAWSALSWPLWSVLP